MSRLRRLVAHLGRVATAPRRLARDLARAGDAARDRREFRDAAILYEQALRLRPGWAAVLIQAGHMWKEAGERDRAERHYRAAAAALPRDADLALQLGHFFKIAGRFDEAGAEYRRALTIDPGTGDAARELAELAVRGAAPTDLAAGADEDVPAPELLPVDAPAPAPVCDGIELARLGCRLERSRWGLLPLLSGVEAIRGTCRSREPMTRVELLVDGAVVLAEAPAIVPAAEPGGPAKAVFNLWWDASALEPGLHRLELRVSGDGAPTRRRESHVVVAPPIGEADAPGSDGVVEHDPADPRPLAEQVRARASMVRAAGSADLGEVRAILVMRTDQLGDMVISVPALRRLREIFPQARVVGLVTEANRALAETLGLFDEVFAINFPEIEAQRRRVMPALEQRRLRERLAPYRFDLAIDLATSQMSRPLLKLSGARHTVGFGDGEWPWLWTGADGGTHDPANRMEATPQSGRVRWLIERLATLADSGARVVRRADLSRERLAAFGLAADARYAVLHTGARIAFSRWPHYAELADRLLADTDLHVVLLVEEVAALPAALRAHARVRLVDGRVAFDDFDALLSFCALFVGNDSGPKHLAALRGVPVVSIHSARINWGDWAQEQTGLVISRRVPCAGCALYHHPEECGRDHACVTDIRVDEVLAAAKQVLAQGAPGQVASPG